MRFKGEIGYCLYWIHAIVKIPMSEARPRIKFLIDTGTPYTIISHRDAEGFGINISTLQRHSQKISGVTDNGFTGGVVPHVIDNCDIILDDEDYDKSFSTNMTKLFVYPEGDNISTNSVLGIDFLKKYTLKFDEESVILEI
jgi:predicted aspartyl protease